jgi:N-acyl homoserine lactone hydrolase
VSARTGVRRVVPLVLGWEHIARSISMPLLDDGRAHEILREPVPGLLLEVDGGWLLVDSGFNVPLVRDPALYRRYWGTPGIEIELAGPSDRDPLESAFELAGVDVHDVVGVCISHFHNDHSGGLRHFTERVPFYVQRVEYEAAMADTDRSEREAAMFRIDWDDQRTDWRFLDGDAEIAPGVHALLTAGHTPGHTSYVVELDPAVRDDHPVPGYVFACDAADLQENLDTEEPPTVAFGDDYEAAREAIRRIKRVGVERGFRVVPGHDPEVWPAFAAEMGVEVHHHGTLAPDLHRAARG